MKYHELLHEMRIDLDKFWLTFGGKLNYGRGYSKEEKIDALIKMASGIEVPDAFLSQDSLTMPGGSEAYHTI